MSEPYRPEPYRPSEGATAREWQNGYEQVCRYYADARNSYDLASHALDAARAQVAGLTAERDALRAALGALLREWELLAYLWAEGDPLAIDSTAAGAVADARELLTPPPAPEAP